jgi:hypothetical protein
MKKLSPIPPHNSPKNWVEDFKFENGNYICHCYLCDGYFYGYKRRVVCKECSDKGVLSDNYLKQTI